MKIVAAHKKKNTLDYLFIPYRCQQPGHIIISLFILFDMIRLTWWWPSEWNKKRIRTLNSGRMYACVIKLCAAGCCKKLLLFSILFDYFWRYRRNSKLFSLFFVTFSFVFARLALDSKLYFFFIMCICKLCVCHFIVSHSGLSYRFYSCILYENASRDGALLLLQADSKLYNNRFQWTRSAWIFCRFCCWIFEIKIRTLGWVNCRVNHSRALEKEDKNKWHECIKTTKQTQTMH